MKRLTYLAVTIAFLIGVSITFNACEKEYHKPNDNAPDLVISKTTKVIFNSDWLEEL